MISSIVFLAIKWRVTALFFIYAFIGLIALIIIFKIYSSGKTAQRKKALKIYYLHLLGHVELEKRLISHIHNLEKGERNEEKIKAAFRKEVLENADLTIPTFASDKELKDLKKSIRV